MTEVNFQALMSSAGEGFKPVPSGDYQAVWTKSEATTSKGGKAMIRGQFRIVGGPHDGRLVFNNFVISPESANALGFFFQHMEALGLSRDYFNANPPMPQVAQALEGRQATITVGIRQYKGQDQNDITSVRPPQGGQIGGGAPAASYGPGSIPPAAPVMQAPPAAPPVATSAEVPAPPPGVVQQPAPPAAPAPPPPPAPPF